jgi:lambda family phage minor tail protein L
MPTQAQITSVLTELYKYNPSAIIELVEIDLTPLREYYLSKGVTISPLIYRFHNGTNQKATGVPPLTNTDVVWNGNTYYARPIQLDGIQVSTSGEIPRPTLIIANHDLLFTELSKAYANLLRAKVTRIRTFVKFLDAVNFISGTNPTADPNAKFPDDKFFIDRLAEEIPGQITFELAPAWDVEGVLLPRRQILANLCPWTYKEDPCNWSVGGAATVSIVSGTAPTSSVLTQFGTRRTTTLTGTGTGLRVGVRIPANPSGLSYSAIGTTFTLADYLGYNYSVNDTVKILGSSVGGTSPTNDLVLRIDSITGNKYFNENDIIVTDASQDRCGKRLTSCRLRFGTQVLPFGGFPSAGLYGKPI